MNTLIRVTAIVTSCWMFAAAITAQAETLRIASEGAYPPFNYIDPDNTLHGFDIDIANALCERMQVTCTFVTQD